ncbi:hypothetical protein C5U48_13005 [Mycolicibacter virginiensis]|uniref:Uncharacterized protein n=1 Tax=Mycolicibacter virginiensis TaxID=1795032 RepID=A0A9X7IMJ9_9MYCO|nr:MULTISPECIES: hypothetical protein [Mycobacteriaceae]PQM51838.1 hypothetical protein C5U48_13005 [Mycolicibacter virginiensis]
MFQVRTKGQIVALNSDLMTLVDNADGATMVTASRADGVWTIAADGQPDRTAADRPAALQAMCDLAVELCDGTFFTAQYPPGLDEMP